MPAELPVMKRIPSTDDLVALDSRKLLDEHGIVAVNVMASPGAGKTSLILRMIEALLPVSCKTGDGRAAWVEWPIKQRN